MNAPSYIPSFYFSKFAQGLSSPYTSFEAYRSGAIDSSGNIVKPESSIDPLEYFIIKLKKILDELPAGLTKAQLTNYMSTVQLFEQQALGFGITENEYRGLIESHLILNVNPSLSYIELCEDMATGAMATPAPAPGANQGNVSGYDPVMGMQKRTSLLKGMENCEMFDVCPEEMAGFKSAKAWKHVPDSETKRYLQRYQRRNPTGHMAVRSVDPDTGKSEVHWVKLKPMSFMEEFGLNTLDILNEDDAVSAYQDNVSQTDTNVAVQSNNEEMPYDIPKHLHPKIAEFVSASLNMKYRTKANKEAGLIVDRKDSHAAELHARMILFAKGLEDISKITDTKKRHETFSAFINAAYEGRHKNPSVADERSKQKHPDAWSYHPEHGVVRREIKTDRYEGSFPTNLSNLATPEQIEQEKQRNIRNLQQQWTSDIVVRRNQSGNFFDVSPESVSSIWLGHPARVKPRSRGESVRQENPESAGRVLKILSLRSLTSKREDPLKVNQKTIDLLKQHTEQTEHHGMLDRILGRHV